MPKTTKDILTREHLKAAHFLAYSWVLERLADRLLKNHSLVIGEDGTLKPEALDFGCRHSWLPALMVLAGWRVIGFDRDETSHDAQRSHADEIGEFKNKITTLSSDKVEALLDIGVRREFDAVTAVFAIQHNEVEAQKAIVRWLAEILRPGGSLLVVSSYTAGETFHQTNRDDPQWVLSMDGHQDLIDASRLELEFPIRFMRYDHGTINGNFCGERDACAICYELRKPV